MKNLIPWRKKDQNAVPSLFNDDWFTRIPEKSLTSAWFPLISSFSSLSPSVDVSENKKEVIVKAEVPGMTEKDLDITWNNGILRIKGEKKAEKEENSKGRFYRECSYGSFCRNIPLGENVDWKNTKADYKNGVLTIKLPKDEKTVKSIQVKVN